MASGQETVDVQYLQLVQQLIELQKENNELRRGSVQGKSASKPPERPVIEQGSTDIEWALFVDSWNRYKEMCRLTDPAEIRNELRSTCSTKMNRILFELVGTEILSTTIEHQLLHQIRLVAVKGVHKEVHRQTFHNMRQQEGEPVTHFLAKL